MNEYSVLFKFFRLGRVTTLPITVTKAAWEKAQWLQKEGYRFEAEILRTGVWSFAIATEEEDLSIELVRSRVGIPRAVSVLIERVYTHIWREDSNG